MDGTKVQEHLNDGSAVVYTKTGFSILASDPLQPTATQDLAHVMFFNELTEGKEVANIGNVLEASERTENKQASSTSQEKQHGNMQVLLFGLGSIGDK